MSFDITNPVWVQTGLDNVLAGGGIVEDGNSNRHSIYQDIQPLVNAGWGTSGVCYARVRPIGRDYCWMGIRQNNSFYAVKYRLTGVGSVESDLGSINATSATITEVGDGSYNLFIVFDGTFSTTNTVFAIGSLLDDLELTYTGQSGLEALRIERAACYPGTQIYDYEPQTDQTQFLDQQTDDGSQDATLPASNAPSTLPTSYIDCNGSDPLTVADFSFPLNGFTVCAVVDRSSTTTTAVIAGQWESGQLSWKLELDADGKLAVCLSGNGSTIHKDYVASRAVDAGVKTLLSFTWDGSSLKIFYNDIELAGDEIDRATDLPLSGLLNDASSPISEVDSHFGKAHEIRLYNDARTPAQIATIAAEFGVSGLPIGGVDPPPTPTTGDYIIQNGVVVIEAESFPSSAAFVQESSLAGFVGDGYIRHTGSDDFTLPPDNIIEIPFYVDEAGTYEIALRVNHELAAADDEENDCWLEVPTANDALGFQKWGHRPTEWQDGWTFGTFREPTTGVFTDKWFDLDAGSHTLQIGGRSQDWRFDRVHIFKLSVASPLDETLPESPRSGVGGGGNVPNTRAEMEAYLTNTHGITNFRYVNNQSGNDANSGTSPGDAWATIQKAARDAGAGTGVIISGEGGPFYESVTLRNSGSVGNRIWFAGDPEFPPIIDGSQVFTAASSGAWVNMGSDRWRAPYGLTRDWTRLAAYHDTNCSNSPPCVHESVAIGHQMIYNKKQLVRLSAATVPASFREGECFFEVGTGSYETPQYVWVRLQGDVDPNTVEMRACRTNSVTADNPTGGNHLWDWNSDSGNVWNGHTGGSGAQRAVGRNHIGMLNLHFRFSVDCSRDIGSVNIRGNGWHVEWCSFSEMNAYGFGIYGDNHLVRNCRTLNGGQGFFRGEYLQENAGTTRIELCLFENNNIHNHPIAWEAGHKYSNCGNGGRIEHVKCLFINDTTDPRWTPAGGLWWDIRNGPQNPSDDAFLVEDCFFIHMGRWAIFMENNAYHLTMRNSAIFATIDMEAGGAQVYEGAGIKFSGSGKSQITNNAIVRCAGPGFHGKTEGSGATQGQNQNTIQDNVWVENAHSTNTPGFLDKNYIGGPSPSEAWNTSDIDGNVFNKSANANFEFGQNSTGNYNTNTNDLATFEGWHGGTGNVLEANSLNIVESLTDPEQFWKTANGSYPTKGPQNLIWFYDLSETGWTIPT